ncbi:CRP-like cAMP-binding protein [Sunxiuqinia elliptica]|uniref:CRP-like cAMP-binding protein n=2 Tax=Sunxiuqinia elliptica TaxID=655355 RepID=A0A4R6GP02_9BACT|nr:CRP-like cAMP-binding protein [Sunxiuqinia elliptica]TDO68051.1 CRP-like cAMP-binding protein [Sunxiuqinia elliptica]
MSAYSIHETDNSTLALLMEYFAKQESVSLKKGETFLAYDEPNQKLGILLKGLMYATYVAESGQEWISRFFYTPDNAVLSSHDSFLSGENSTEAIRAYEDSEIIFISKPEFEKLLENSSELQSLVRRMAEESYVNALKRVHMLQSLTASQRVKQFVKEHRDLVSRVQRQHIASYLGIHRNIFTRILNKI